MLFYSAVHELRAFLMNKKGVSVTTHQEVTNMERRNIYPELKSRGVWKKYNLLRRQSEQVRYYGTVFPLSDFQSLEGTLRRLTVLQR